MADERNRLKVLQELKKAQAELNSLQKDGERVFADNLDKNKHRLPHRLSCLLDYPLPMTVMSTIKWLVIKSYMSR